MNNRQFPYNLPKDEDVEVDLSIATTTPLDLPNEEIFCKICTFPMSIKIKLSPCNHSICQKCFEIYNEECKFCGFEIADAKLKENTF